MTDGPRDPGLQAERTALSWRRTAAAVVVNGLLVLRSGVTTERAAITVLAVVLLIAAAGLFVFGAWRWRVLLSARDDVTAPALAPALTAAVTLIACASGIASIVQ